MMYSVKANAAVDDSDACSDRGPEQSQNVALSRDFMLVSYAQTWPPTAPVK